MPLAVQALGGLRTRLHCDDGAIASHAQHSTTMSSGDGLDGDVFLSCSTLEKSMSRNYPRVYEASTQNSGQ